MWQRSREVTQFSKEVSEGQPGHRSMFSHLSRCDREDVKSLSFQKKSQEASQDTNLCTLISLDVTEKPWSHSVFKRSLRRPARYRSMYSHLSRCDREAVEWNSLWVCYRSSHLVYKSSLIRPAGTPISVLSSLYPWQWSRGVEQPESVLLLQSLSSQKKSQRQASTPISVLSSL
jgi:hypothetical protein